MIWSVTGTKFDTVRVVAVCDCPVETSAQTRATPSKDSLRHLIALSLGFKTSCPGLPSFMRSIGIVVAAERAATDASANCATCTANTGWPAPWWVTDRASLSEGAQSQS